MSSIDLNGIEPFNAHGDPGHLQQEWKRWLRSFDLFATGKGVTDKKQLKALLLHCAGVPVQDIYFTLTEAEGGDEYAVAVATLSKHFETKINVPYERYVFRSMCQEDESIEQFITRLRRQAVLCEFGNIEEQIRDQIIEKCKSHKLRTKCLEKGKELTLDQLRTIAATMEMADVQAKKMESPLSSVNQINFVKQKDTKRSTSSSTKALCFRCGREGHFAKDSGCPAKNKKCNKCGKMGHFRACCKTKEPRCLKAERSTLSKVKGKVNCVESEAEYAFSVQHTDADRLSFMVGGHKVDMVVDSGATVNIIDKPTWEDLKKRKIVCRSEKTDKRLYSYGADKPLSLLGKFITTVSVDGSDDEIEAAFYVLDGTGSALLGRATAVDLGVLKIGVYSVHDDILDKYKSCFGGIGKLNDFKLKLHIDPSVKPVAQPMYRIPYSLREKVGAKLDELEDQDIIEKVNDPTPWVSPVIVVPKPNGDIRICVDMRQANQAIVRERHPIPTVDEILYNMNGSTVFSKLDMKYGYHQIELEDSSREITTFVTHQGLYRYKRLMFGISSAPEKYQQIISQTFHDCEGVQNISDDIVVHGRDKHEHDQRLEKALCRLQEKNLTLNKEKCEWGMDKITFMGHVLSKNGIAPTSDRSKAIIEAQRPQSASEEQEDCFRALKESLVNADTLGHFRLDATKTQLVTDASDVGLGAVLVQESEGETKVISYASRTLTDVERRYSTTEKEALAVVWACGKFHIYLYGIDFELVTDHKPLEILYGPKSKPNARIERWVMRLMPYNFRIRYQPGKQNIADALSRLVKRKHSGVTDLQTETEHYVRAVAERSTPKAMTTREVEEKSKSDPELTLVRKALSADQWEKECVKYYAVKDELSQIGYLLLRGTRLVIPAVLRTECIKLAHQGHLGIVATKQQLRTKVWWPTLDKDVEAYVKSCHGCQVVSSLPRPEPISPTPMPSGPWQDLSIDLLGPLPSGHYVFVVIDYYSRYYEVDITKDISSERMIDALENMFARYGLPVSITSDNGPQFVSALFEEFLCDNGIHHRRVTPLHPAANGEVERQNRSIMKRIRIAHAESRDWKKDLRTYLLAYRGTPHAVTGVSPAELMFGRKLRNKVPQLDVHRNETIEEGVRDRDWFAKVKNKLYIDEKRGAKESDLVEGDQVLVKQSRNNKLSSPFNPTPFKLQRKVGNQCTLVSPEGVEYKRNSTHVKKYVQSPESLVESKSTTATSESESLTMSDNNVSKQDKADDDVMHRSTNDGMESNLSHQVEIPRSRPVREKTKPKRFDDFEMT
ncbi:uncharacterized protein K02A2.6-like [Ylistrum balloti]|uniref:uncharacterized protein K02A2.6-like n=1 Tax=Ylistrum balloti TaxID=509963 RepID=UPI002905D16B|nr:uncharacterized protein K02A2.6-like [Ylistrum balloti]